MSESRQDTLALGSRIEDYAAHLKRKVGHQWRKAQGLRRCVGAEGVLYLAWDDGRGWGAAVIRRHDGVGIAWEGARIRRVALAGRVGRADGVKGMSTTWPEKRSQARGDCGLMETRVQTTNH